MKLLEERSQGWDFRIKNRKTGIWKSGVKFHYFKGGISLCGKYENDRGNYLPTSALTKEDCCKQCLKQLKRR